MTIKNEDTIGIEIRNKLDSISKDILATSQPIDKMVEYYLYCSQQAVHQIESLLNKDKIDYNDKLHSIREWSINLANFSLAMNSTILELDSNIKSDKITFPNTVIDNVDILPTYLKRQFYEHIFNHTLRLNKKVHIIDSLKQLFVDLASMVLKDTDKSILSDTNILNIIKEYFKVECYRHLILCHDEIFVQCTLYYIETKKT